MPTNTHINEIVTFCYNYICYSGKYSPHHPRIPPGIVYGLSAGIAENMPLVVYNSTPSLASHSYSIFYWLSHYSSVFAMLLLGSTYFRCLFLSTHYVGRSNEEEKAGDDPSKTEDRYQERYYEKYDIIKQKEKDQEAVTTSSLATNNTNTNTHSSLNRVIDYTGQYGNIMMYYNTESDSFDYFSDNKSIPFNYLETVSRKLGISFHCTDKIIDRRNVLKQKQNEEKYKKEKLSENNKEKEITNDVRRKESSTSSNEWKPKDPRHLANIVKAKANKFIYVGKFSSMNPLQTIQYDEACTSKKSIRSKLSYKEYMDSLQYA